MLYMEEWKMIVFLGTPQMNDLDAMIRVGLFINDLSMHDFSRYLLVLQDYSISYFLTP